MICKKIKKLKAEAILESRFLSSKLGTGLKHYSLQLFHCKINQHARKFKGPLYNYKVQKQKEFERSHLKQGVGIVLAFHYINSNSSHITALSLEKFQKIVLEFQKYWKPINQLDSGGLFITFDDAFSEQFNLGFQFLLKFNIPACFFVPVDSIDKDGYFSLSQLQQISNNPLYSIGSHCLSHLPLSLGSRSFQKKQICLSKNWFNKSINKSVSYFAYPWGGINDFSKKDESFIKKANYDFAFSTFSCPFSRSDIKKRFSIPRIQICNSNFEEIENLIFTFLKNQTISNTDEAKHI